MNEELSQMMNHKERDRVVGEIYKDTTGLQASISVVLLRRKQDFSSMS
jgi:hypothetical protein